MNKTNDVTVRVELYRVARDEQRLLSSSELAARLGLSTSSVDDSFERLAREHVIVLGPDGRVHMAMPFSGVPTTVRVTRDGKQWWANCAWDGLGIPAAIDGGRLETTIETDCADCRERMRISVSGGEARDADTRSEPVVHFAVPAARWWEDIRFT